MTYYRVEPGIHSIYGVTEDPELPEDVSFTSGEHITASLASPLTFEVDYPAGETPQHFGGITVPVASKQFVDVLSGAGVDNYQLFPAILHNPETGRTWKNYHAFNVVGVVDAADLGASKYDTIMGGSDDMPPLLDFEELVLRESQTRNLLMFRLLHNRNLLFVHEKVRQALKAAKPPEGWGITTFEVVAR